MRLKRAELLTVLESLQPGLTTKDVIEQSSCFAFANGYVYTFNDEIACRRKSPLKIEGAVQATPLLTMLRKYTEEEVDIELAEGELVLRGKGNRRTGIRTQADVALPYDKVEWPKKNDWQELNEDFSDAVYVARQCVGKDESNYVSTCIHITRKYIEACDNSQAIRYKIKTGVKENVLVRGKSLQHVVSPDMGMTKFCETDLWMHFRNPTGLVMGCRRDVQEYEPLDGILEVEGTPIALPKGLMDAADKAETFSAENPDDNEVLIEIKPGKLRIVGEGASGWHSETKKLKYSGKPISFKVGPKLLIELVKRYTDCHVAPDKLKVDTGKFTYVVALTAARKSNGEDTGEGE